MRKINKMRQNLRVKMDFSQMFQDARRHSWVYIDSTKILYVYQLAEHVGELFEIKRPFHFISKHEEMYLFLPFQEDIRILENNDTVIIVPGTGIADGCETNDAEESSGSKQNGFATAANFEEKETIRSPETFYTINNTDENIKEDNITFDNILSKKKRIRKKRQKKFLTLSPENNVSYTEYSSKKPKIIDSVLISSGKHIRFKNLEDEDTVPDTKLANENCIQDNQVNNEVTNTHWINEHLNVLLNLRQSSTPLTFGYKKIKNELKSEVIDENFKHLIKPEKTVDVVQLNENNALNDTISFKVYRMESDYTPQLSNVIIAKILSYDVTKLEYTLKILRGKDQLQEPEGKFSLPIDEDSINTEDTDIVTFNKSELIDLKIVTKIDNSF